MNGLTHEEMLQPVSSHTCKIYSFIMPEIDSEIVINVNGLSDYSCSDNLHQYEEKIIKTEKADSYIKKSTCRLCEKKIEEEITEIKLNSETLYYSYYSNRNIFEEFANEFTLFNKKYLIIDNADLYFTVYPNIPNRNNELLSKDDANKFFKDNIIVLYIRYISGTIDYIYVDYYYDTETLSVSRKYLGDVTGNYYDIFLGYAIDLITIPKEYYNKIVK